MRNSSFFTNIYKSLSRVQVSIKNIFLLRRSKKTHRKRELNYEHMALGQRSCYKMAAIKMVIPEVM